MSWTLSVSARKAVFADALEHAVPVHEGELGREAEVQVACLRTFVLDALTTYERDDGMVGLYATGGGGEAQGLVSVSLSVASETLPQEPSDVAPEVTEARSGVHSRYAPGERPEAPGAVDRRALEVAAEAEANDPRRAAYQPDREPDEQPSRPTSLAEDHKATADAKAEARKSAQRSK